VLPFSKQDGSGMVFFEVCSLFWFFEFYFKQPKRRRVKFIIFNPLIKKGENL